MVPRVARLALLAASCAVLVLWAGCSSSRPSSSPAEQSTDPAPTGPAVSLLYATDGGALVHHDARTNASDTLASGVQSGGTQAVSPSGRLVAFSYTTADSSRLAMLDRTDGTLQPIYARGGTDVYSLAWHPSEDQLAFGVYTPIERGTRGPGTIRIATPDGASRSVGCSTAREVLDWLPSGALTARTDDRLYAVAPADCATRTSADARRMHEAAYASTGTRLAYIHRELTYDEEARDYTPDSSLFLSDARAQNPAEVLGPDRRPRHLRWAPVGTELALDVQTEASGHRQVVVYRDSLDRTIYLTPPSSTTSDQTHPRWSPDGNYVAFTRGRGAEAQAAVRVEGQTRSLGAVDEAVWGWTGPRSVVVPGPDSLRIQSLRGTTRYIHPAPATLIHAWSRSPS